MRICVFGAGALGSAIGGLLASSNDVVLVGRQAHVKAIKKDGLRLLGDVQRVVRIQAVENLDGICPTELVVLTTKAYDTEEAVAELRGWAGGFTRVLTLQNGLGNVEILRRWKGRGAFGGITTMGATLLRPGRVRISGLGRTVIGSDADVRGAQDIEAAFASSGIPTSTSRDIMEEIWGKAVVSACINPATAILGVTNGTLLTSPVIRRLLSDVCAECVALASAEGVELNQRALWSKVVAVAQDTARNRSSMLQDIENGKRTEIDQINGAFSAIGDRHGVSTPLNDVLAAMVRSLERRPRPQKG